MITDDEFLELLKKLLERSRKDEVAWKSTPTEYEYALRLPQSRIELRFVEPEADADAILVWLYNRRGEVVKALRIPDESDNWALASDLWREASRTVLEWDKALDDVKKALAKPGVVGSNPESDDDIRF